MNFSYALGIFVFLFVQDTAAQSSPAGVRAVNIENERILLRGNIPKSFGEPQPSTMKAIVGKSNQRADDRQRHLDEEEDVSESPTETAIDEDPLVADSPTVGPTTAFPTGDETIISFETENPTDIPSKAPSQRPIMETVITVNPVESPTDTPAEPGTTQAPVESPTDTPTKTLDNGNPTNPVSAPTAAPSPVPRPTELPHPLYVRNFAYVGSNMLRSNYVSPNRLSSF